MADEVLRDFDQDPEAADLVDRPEAFFIDDDEILTICGVEFPVQEFTEAERLEWLRIREKHGLLEAEVEYRDLITKLTKTDRNNLLKAKRARLTRIKDEIDRVVTKGDPLDWSEKDDEYLGNLSAEADKLEAEILELEQPIDKEMYDKMDEIQAILEQIKTKRDPAFLEMAWKLARYKFDEKRSLDEWISSAKGSDRLAAQELVYKGNFMWEAPRLTRAQRRQMQRNRKKKRSSTTTDTGSSTSKQ